VAAVFCNRCGCENPESRGACLMCLNFLRWPSAGNVCASCGGDNAGDADFCASCGAAMGEVAAVAVGVQEAVNLVLGGAAEEERVVEEGYLGEADELEPAAVPEIDFEAPLEAEAPPAPPPEPEAEEPEPFEPVAPLAAEIEEPAAPPPPPPAEPAGAPEFEELAIELDEAGAAADEDEEPPPPPPPGALELEQEPAEEDAEFGGWSIDLEEEEESGQQ
jgi:hypothetical protein